MSTKILISENKERADLHIKELNERAERMTALVAFYNSQPVLKELTTKKDVFKFLENPINYLHEAIIKDTGVTFSEKAAPAPGQVAKIFNIPYDGITDKIYRARIGQLGNFDFDEKKAIIYLTDEAKVYIYEQYREYTKDDAETKAFMLMQKTCTLLNDYTERFNVDMIDRNQIAERLGLRIDDKTFIPYVNGFKKRMEHSGTKENFN